MMRGTQAPRSPTAADAGAGQGTMGEYLAMGGHGGFIWPAYLAAAAVMAGLLVASLRALRARQAELDALETRRRGGDAEAVDEA